MAGHVKDREAYERLNYLYQAAHCVLSQNPNNLELARFYCFTQKNISKRLVLRQDPSVKRTLCKKCCSLLIPGVTATSRQRRHSRRTRSTVLRCLSCGTIRKLLNDPERRLWVERPEAQLENQTQPDAAPPTRAPSKTPKNQPQSSKSKSEDSQKVHPAEPKT